MDQDITTLEKELIAITASIPTSLVSGNHGHAGLTIESTKYVATTGGTAFTIPEHIKEFTRPALQRAHPQESEQKKKRTTNNFLPNSRF